jgi:hypothetical protein
MPGRTIYWLRWVLLAPAAAAGWLMVVLAGIAIHDHFEISLCPPEDVVSGFCYNERVLLFLDLITLGFAGISAFTVLVVAIAAAPSHKLIVAWLTFALGATTIAMGMGPHANPEPLTALLVGFIAAIGYTVESRRREANATATPLH